MKNGIFLMSLIVALTNCKNVPPKEAIYDFSQMGQQLLEVYENNQLMGMSVLLIADGNVAWEKNYGLANYTTQMPIDSNTLFRVASISKTITTTAIMQLVEKGVLDLNRDVSHYLGWSLRNPKYPEDSISLKMLLNHQSSIRDGEGYGRFSREMIEKKLHIQELFQANGSYYTEDLFADHAPGSYFSYTNCTWGIIVSILEKVSGTRFDQYCKANVFKPLDLQTTFNVEDIDDINNLGVLYRYIDSSWVAQVDDYKGKQPPSRAFEGYELGQNGLIFGPQGSLRSSARELGKFAIMLLNKGEYNGKRILSEASVEAMTQQHWTFTENNGDTWENFFLSYGLGIHHITNKDSSDIIFPDRKMFGHPGIAYGLLSDMYVDPIHKSGIVFITNGSQQSYDYAKNSTFYQVEEDVFSVVYPYLKEIEAQD